MTPVPHRAGEALGLLLVLRAFASGATAMTGIEVISNAVPVFQPPEADNARKTLSAMIILLVAMFVGVVIVAHLDGASPGTQTVLSQIAHRSVGGGPLYAFVQLSTTLVLLVAANSAVNGFPRLLYFMARDGYVPRTFLHMGDRLAFTAGIVVLAVPASILFAGFNGQTEPLIPLFAIGVFVAFTLAQSAMVAYWWRRREHSWRRSLAVNLLGAVLSGAGGGDRGSHEICTRRLDRCVPDPRDRGRLPADPSLLPARRRSARPAARSSARDVQRDACLWNRGADRRGSERR